MDMCCLSEWMLTPPFLPTACCHGDVVRRAGAITPWALPVVVLLFFSYPLLFLPPLLSAFLFCCRRYQSNYLPSPFHKYLLHTHSYSFWVTRMQHFFLSRSLPLSLVFILSSSPPHRCHSLSLSLSHWGISGFLLFLDVSQFYPCCADRLVLTNKSKGKGRFALYILSFSLGRALICICRQNYCSDHLASVFLLLVTDIIRKAEVREISLWSWQLIKDVMLVAKTEILEFICLQHRHLNQQVSCTPAWESATISAIFFFIFCF